MEGNRESDAQLLRRMQLGDDKALGLLMERYAGYVYRVIANVLLQSGTASDAEELTSDTFYAVWNSPPETRQRAFFGSSGSCPWIWTPCLCLTESVWRTVPWSRS